MKTTNKLFRLGVSSIAMVLLLTCAILVRTEDSQAQSSGFLRVLDVIDQVRDAADEFTGGLEMALDAADAVRGESSKGEISSSRFGAALTAQLHALNHAYIPGPPDMSGLVVSYGDIADPTTRCLGYKKLQDGVDALKKWQTGNKTVLDNGRSAQAKLLKAETTRRQLEELAEKCAFHGCGEFWSIVETSGDLAVDISAAESAIKDLIITAEKDKAQYSADVDKKLSDYENAINWVKSSIPNIDRICELEDDIYSKQETTNGEKDPLAELVKSLDTSPQERQVANYLHGLDGKMTGVEQRINERKTQIAEWKKQAMADIHNNPDTAALVAAGAMFDGVVGAAGGSRTAPQISANQNSSRVIEYCDYKTGYIPSVRPGTRLKRVCPYGSQNVDRSK